VNFSTTATSIPLLLMLGMVWREAPTDTQLEHRPQASTLFKRDPHGVARHQRWPPPPLARQTFRQRCAFQGCDDVRRAAARPARNALPMIPVAEALMPLSMSSTAFTHEGVIPTRHACDGADVSPPLAWSGVPEGAASLVLIVDDPDAPEPESPWVHWVLYNIPPSTTALAESTDHQALPPGTQAGVNGWKRPGWRGPCPPSGRHRYYFRLYALDALIHPSGASRHDVEKAMHGHILGQAVLMGTYQRKR